MKLSHFTTLTAEGDIEKGAKVTGEPQLAFTISSNGHLWRRWSGQLQDNLSNRYLV